MTLKGSYYKSLRKVFSDREWRNLFHYLFLSFFRPLFILLSLVSVMPFLSIALAPEKIFSSKIMSFVYRSLEFQSENSFLLFLGAMTFVLLLASNAYSLFVILESGKCSQRLRTRLSEALYRRCLNQSFLEFSMCDLSGVRQMAVHSVEKAVEDGVFSLINAVTSALSILLIVGFLLFVEPISTLLVVAFFGLSYGLIYARVRKRLTQANSEAEAAWSERLRVLTEPFKGFAEVKLSGGGEYFVSRFRESSNTVYEKHLIQKFIEEVPRHAVDSCGFGALILAAMYLLKVEGKGGSYLPVLGFFALSCQRLAPELRRLFYSLTLWKAGKLSLVKIMNFLSHETRIDSLRSVTFNDKIEIQNLTFRYQHASRLVLRETSFTLPKGSRTAFIGASGAGKSTLVNLITGLLTPSSGGVLVDGVPLTDGLIKSWQTKIGYAATENLILEDTIARNVVFALENNDIDHDRVEKVCQWVLLHEDIRLMTNGYDSVLSEGGHRLSAGQRQRLAIARALYRNPEVLVLDEATSCLDFDTERLILNTIRAKSPVTILLVTHRMQVADWCERVFEVESTGSVRPWDRINRAPANRQPELSC